MCICCVLHRCERWWAHLRSTDTTTISNRNFYICRCKAFYTFHTSVTYIDSLVSIWWMRMNRRLKCNNINVKSPNSRNKKYEKPSDGVRMHWIDTIFPLNWFPCLWMANETVSACVWVTQSWIFMDTINPMLSLGLYFDFPLNQFLLYRRTWCADAKREIP